MNKVELLFIDVETGGINPFESSLLEVGMIHVIYDIDLKKCESINTLNFPIKQDPYIVSGAAMKYNKINLFDDIYSCGISKKEMVEKIINFLDQFNSKPILVAHNYYFDKIFLKKLFYDCSYELDNYISHRSIDTMTLLYNLHFNNKIPDKALSGNGAFEYFEINVDNRHRAISDCKATIELFEKIMNY